MSLDGLRRALEALGAEREPDAARARAAVAELLDALASGAVRAAEPGPGGWTVNAWVKAGLLLAFRVGINHSLELPPAFFFRDRDTLPVGNPARGPGDVRIVPGGTTVRHGAHLGERVVVMPPAFVNVGAWIGPETMIDSHVLVGSCAQIGARVHLSAGAQIGGVLEPVGSLPVIVEDEAFIGGGCGVYEGTRVAARAVLAAGVVLTRAVALYDLVHEQVLRAPAGAPLVVPAGAVVVPGARPAGGEFARRHGVTLQTPVIVRYREAGRAAALELEEALR